MSQGATADRPRADALLPLMVDRPGKLTFAATSRAEGEWRCPHRHLLAAVVKTPYGPWLYRHSVPLGDAYGDAWQCDWQADLDSPTANTWCNCPNSWTVDTVSPGTPPLLMR